jgi:uncharacterized membrane protein YadS
MAKSYAFTPALRSLLGKTGLTATLFLIGTGLSRATLRRVGVRSLLQEVILWIVVAVSSLWLIVARCRLHLPTLWLH